MHNDPELSGKYLGTISGDFIKVCDTLKEASYQIRKRGISEFPIFPICKADQPVGQLIIHKEQLDTDWNYFASFMDEFVQRGIIDPDKQADFKKTYKEADEYCCLFVIDREFTNFVFIPYPED
jgi:hypothetical protein